MMSESYQDCRLRAKLATLRLRDRKDMDRVTRTDINSILEILDGLAAMMLQESKDAETMMREMMP